jgi:hypothetical protein
LECNMDNFNNSAGRESLWNIVGACFINGLPCERESLRG